MPRPIGERRKLAIELRITHSLSTSEIARELNVAYSVAKRYVEHYPLTPEEIKENTKRSVAKRWEGYNKKPRSKVKQRIRMHNHYIKNKKQYRNRNRRTTDKIKLEIRHIKEMTPCADCHHKFHFAAMDFDHREGELKEFNVARMYTLGSLKRVLCEMAKCDIVCSNCHRVRTYNRGLRSRGATDSVAVS